MTGILVAWLTHFHGRGEPHQHDYFRCATCRRIVTWQGIRKGGCPCGGPRQVSPAALTWWEKCRLLLLPTVGVVR